MNEKNKLIVVASAVVVIALAVFAGYSLRGNGGAAPNTAQPSGIVSGTPVAATSATRTAVPANVVVPDKSAATALADVAIPVVQSIGDPSGTVSYRSFNISIQNGTFSPDTVIVKQGDTVNLELAAIDAAYGFTQPDYGFNVAIAKGKTQTIQFQALQNGNFTFYCASCGGPAQGPVGHIIVVTK